MIKLVYSPEDNIPVMDNLCLVAQGIQAIMTAMHCYAVDENGEGSEFREAAVSVWPVLEILMEPIADYFFEPPEKDET
jgi:hypothetical protein